MNTHNICFSGEIRKIFTGYPRLSRPMILIEKCTYVDEATHDTSMHGHPAGKCKT